METAFTYPSTTPNGTAIPKDRHYVLSKHSMVGQIDLPNKSQDFAFSTPPSGEQEGESGVHGDDQHPPQDNSGTTSQVIPEVAPPQIPGSHEPALWPNDENSTLDVPFHELFGLSLPEFELDSSILLPHSWPDIMPEDS